MTKSLICRTCLKLSTSMIPLFTETSLLEKIHAISSIVLSQHEDLPSLVCKQCVTNIDHAFNTRQTLIKSEAKLKRTIKVEDTPTLTWFSPEDHDNSQFEIYTEAEITNPSRSPPPLYVYPIVNREDCGETIQNTNADKNQQPKSIVSDSKGLRKPKDACPGQLEDYTQVESEVESLSPSRSPPPLYPTINREDCGGTVESTKSDEKQQPKPILRKWNAEPLVKKLLCHFCGKQFRQWNFRHHVLIHQEASVNCKVCGKVLKNSLCLRVHMDTHKPPQWTCEYCSKAFKFRSNYLQHRKIHTGNKKYKCSVCEKAFITGSELKDHMRSHTGERPYICEYCKKGFSRPYALKTHIRQHTKEKPFVCEYCAMGFPQKVSLKTHLKSKHPDKITA